MNTEVFYAMPIQGFEEEEITFSVHVCTNCNHEKVHIVTQEDDTHQVFVCTGCHNEITKLIEVQI